MSEIPAVRRRRGQRFLLALLHWTWLLQVWACSTLDRTLAPEPDPARATSLAEPAADAERRRGNLEARAALPAPDGEREGIAKGAELWTSARATLEQRCVVCHGCYDAPCQLKFDAFEGAVRGASAERVYDAARLLAAKPSRLFVDETTVEGWRRRGFRSVLAGEDGKAEGSVLLRMLALKRSYPLPGDRLGLSSRIFDVGINRTEVCPRASDMDVFAKEHGQWGMPFGLPGLTEVEEASLTRWVLAGSPGPVAVQLSAAVEASVKRFEALLNQPDKKSRLIARYIYEHLFFASIHFDKQGEHFFRLVRSRTRPGTSIEEIPTRRPFGDPGTGQIYYRFVLRPPTRLDKRQMPYLLDERRMARWRELFYDAAFVVDELPDYKPETAANPFKAFLQLPVRSRYRFMLEEAHYTMMGFIKGPVCHGQTALNVIQDRFWVAFVDPDASWIEDEARFLAQQVNHLDLPAEDGSTSAMVDWYEYAEQQRRYLKSKAQFLSRTVAAGTPLSLDMLWDGDRDNPNASLTVFRHFDSATVEKGLWGGPPKTAWVVGYALLERIHYLLVAGFDVFGNVGHQVSTRLYMDFLRMEGEHNFLLLLPEVRRHILVGKWYVNVDAQVKNEVYGPLTRVPFEPSIRYETPYPEQGLYEMWVKRFAPLGANSLSLDHVKRPAMQTLLGRLDYVRAEPASRMPETSFLTIIEDGGAATHVTLLRDSAHTNVSHLFNEDERRVPSQDALHVYYGFVGAYPNALFRVNARELQAFVDAVEALSSDADYRALRARFGVLRNRIGFWEHSDQIHRDQVRLDPLGHGLFDYNRLDAL